MKICNDILQKEFCDEQIKIQVAVHQCRILFYMGNSLECVSKGLDALTSFEARLPSFLDRPAEAAAYDNELLDGIDDATKELGMYETFMRLPSLQDDRMLAAHSLLTEMVAPCAWCALHLFHTWALLGVLLTFKYGKCVYSAIHVSSVPDALTLRCLCWVIMFRMSIAQRKIGG